MALTQEQIDRTYKKILDEVVVGLEAGDIEAYEASEIAEYVLGKVEEIESEQAISNFYEQIVDLWPAMDNLLSDKRTEDIEKKEQEASEGALALLQQGKIDEALSVAKTATQQ